MSQNTFLCELWNQVEKLFLKILQTFGEQEENNSDNSCESRDVPLVHQAVFLKRVSASMASISSSALSVSSNHPPPPSTDDIDPNEDNPLWNYVITVNARSQGNNSKWTCKCCGMEFQWSYHRVSAHLLQTKGKGIKVCEYVRDMPDLLVELKKLEKDSLHRKSMSKPKNVPLPTSSTSSLGLGLNVGLGDEYDEKNQPSKRKRSGVAGQLEKAFNLGAREQLDAYIARMFYSARLPFHLAMNPYLVMAFKFAAENSISGYVPPGYNKLRTTLLQKERANIERLLDPTKQSWKEHGCNIVSDRWSDAQQRPLINFMAATSGQAMFMKAVNCEGEVKDIHHIAKLISEVIDEVRHQNVVQVITDNAPVCVAAGLIIETKYPTIFWTSCVVHTLNLALKNICASKETGATAYAFEECNWIAALVDDVMIIKNFIMNHVMRLAIFNECSPLKLLSVAETRFASSIVMLKRFKLIRRGLEGIVMSDKWASYKEDNVGRAAFMKEKVVSDVWWDKIEYILAFTLSIYEMVRFCDTDKPCLHLVYEMWDSMIEKVKAAIYRNEGKMVDGVSLELQTNIIPCSNLY